MDTTIGNHILFESSFSLLSPLIDLPQLESIALGEGSFYFESDESTTDLFMNSASVITQ